MKEILDQLNSVFDHRNRLGIMSVLMVNEWVDHNQLKATLALTDGNLASHLRSLEAAEHIECSKQFVGRKPQTTYRATPLGREAFKKHLDALEALLRSGQRPPKE